VAQLGARLDGIEEVVGSNPIGSTKNFKFFFVLIPKKTITRWRIMDYAYFVAGSGAFLCGIDGSSGRMLDLWQN
jgi:hypothetical protein